MSRIHQPLEQNSKRPTPNTQLEGVWIEIRKLWKGVGDANSGRVIEQVFSLGGPIYVSTSNGWYPPFPSVVMTSVLSSLRIAGTTSTVVQVYKNSTAAADIVATITIPAGERKVRTSINAIPFTGDQDECFVRVTTAGSQAEGLSVQPRFRVL